MRMLSMLALVTLFSCANAIPIAKISAVENNQPPLAAPKREEILLSDVQEMGVTTPCGEQGRPGPLSMGTPTPRKPGSAGGPGSPQREE